MVIQVGRQYFSLGTYMSTIQRSSVEKRKRSNLRTVWVVTPDMEEKRNPSSWVWDANTTSGWMTISILLLPSKTSTGADNALRPNVRMI